MAHQMTHGSLPASSFRIIKGKDKQKSKIDLKLLVHSNHPLPKLIAIVESTFFYIHSNIAIINIFELGETTEFEELLNEIDEGDSI